MSLVDIVATKTSLDRKRPPYGFLENFSMELFRACSTVVYPNRRSASMGAQVSRLFEQLRRRINPLTPETSHRYNFDAAESELRNVLDNSDAFSRTYDTFVDDDSRRTLIRVLLHRCLGARHSPPLSNEDEFWKSYDEIDQKFLVQRGTRKYWTWQLNRYQFPGRHGTIHMHGTPGHVLCEFINPQYRLQTPELTVAAEEGDTIVDGGGCFGDTAIYFADQCGESGKVYSYEFVPRSLELFRENASLNPGLENRIVVIEKALSSTNGNEFRYEDNGPGTTGNKAGRQTATTGTIDELQSSLKDRPISFIKLDIEGAELEAMIGGRETLCAHRPKLAIAVYHCLEHLHAIQNYVDDLNLGYEFGLRHFTPGPWETVLFARARQRTQMFNALGAVGD